MAPRMPRVRSLFLAPAALVAVTAIGCGGGGGKSGKPPAKPKPTASATSFPSAKGNTRVGFALFTPDRKFVTDAAVALYTTRHDGSDVRGPYVARLESLKVKPQFESKTTANDPDAASAVYVA